MKFIILISWLLSSVVLSPAVANSTPRSHSAKAPAALVTFTVSPNSATYTVGQSVTVTVTGGTAGHLYGVQFYDGDPNTTGNLIDLNVRSKSNGGAGNTQTWLTGQQTVWFVVQFANGTDGTGRVLEVVDSDPIASTDKFYDTDPLTIFPKPTLVLTLSPSLSTYTVGQNITATLTGGIVGEDYGIQLYNGTPSDLTNISQYLNANNGMGGSNLIRWQGGQTSASFTISFDAGSVGSGRIVEVSNLDFDHLVDSAPFAVSLPQATVDLTPSLTLPQANFAATGTEAIRNFTLSLVETGGQPTASGAAVITITIPLGYAITFNNAATSINVTGGTTTTVNNANWNLTSSAELQLTLTMKPGQSIGASGQSTLGFTITRSGASKGSANITVNVNDDTGQTYDVNTANNIFARVINAL
ncbi:hypothetical protein [Spirosoma linguale]|uniref:Cohesin domain-containing protein n=1 Tax=Spirosoma linguale (strain ATCC 33905 / DSM 74 / LMG 10896 / Claus 1) TaxID=504472 RepID=D2QTE5_SPILD|nr:hypothetical protein Slin_6115 [Spirosoma linguale DSM 74]